METGNSFPCSQGPATRPLPKPLCCISYCTSPGRDADHLPHLVAEVKCEYELYLLSPHAPSWRVAGHLYLYLVLDSDGLLATMQSFNWKITLVGRPDCLFYSIYWQLYSVTEDHLLTRVLRKRFAVVRRCLLMRISLFFHFLYSLTHLRDIARLWV
jgi:hypothetical protein